MFHPSLISLKNKEITFRKPKNSNLKFCLFANQTLSFKILSLMHLGPNFGYVYFLTSSHMEDLESKTSRFKLRHSYLAFHMSKNLVCV